MVCPDVVVMFLCGGRVAVWWVCSYVVGVFPCGGCVPVWWVCLHVVGESPCGGCVFVSWLCPCVMVCPDVVGLSCIQREFEERRNAEYVEVQRLEEQERRRTHEKVCACVYV